ncbi:MAG: hypothetical protein Q7K34_02210 [archaeon]|nr:hypothetical protein [archaeon]
MKSGMVAISKTELKRLKLKEEIADDLLLQLSKSADDIVEGRIKKSV